MLAAFVSGEADRRIDGNEAGVLAAIGGGLASGAGSSAEYAEVALAGKFISEQFGTSKLRDICEEVINGSDFDAAIETVLVDDFDDFAAFETECDTWSTSYISGGRYKAMDPSGLGWTGMTPLDVQSNSWEVQAGPDNIDGQQLDIFSPWTASGSLDYLSYIDVTSGESARASLVTAGRAVDSLTGKSRMMGFQIQNVDHAIDETMNLIVVSEGQKNRIMDADYAAEMTAMAKSQIVNQSASATLHNANNLYRNAMMLLLDTVS